jgi:23S rRNA pseudouridine2605 synthase
VSRLKRTRYGSVELPQPLLRGHSQELAADRVEALRKSLGLEDGAPSALTLQPVIGQRRAAKSTVHVGGQHRSQGYVGGHNTADEGRELRRFDHVREDRRGRGGKKPHGGLTVSGEAAAKQANKAFKPKGPRQPGQRVRGGKGAGAQENPAAFRTWYVPDGVDTGPAGHRNPDGARGARRGAGRNGPGGGGRPQRGPGGGGGARGNAQPGGRSAHPYGHPGNAPVFPSDHATPGFNPYGERPRSGRPGGDRPGGARPGGNRPGGNRPGGNRPGGNRPGGPRPGGPRGQGRPGGGNRGPQGR